MTQDDVFDGHHPAKGEVQAYVHDLGVPDLPPRSVPFDPGYDPATVISHLGQSGHLMAALKLSMTCWQVAAPEATSAKIAAAHDNDVPLVAGGATFEIAVQHGRLESYFELCASIGIGCIEAGEGFTELAVTAVDTMRLAARYGLDVQFELGRKHEGVFTRDRVAELVDQGKEWLDAGAVRLVVEARESAQAVGLFDESGVYQHERSEQLVGELGLPQLCFESPTKASQFALLDHLGPEVILSNIRLEELLRVEIYRRGMHADSYGHPLLGSWALDDSAPDGFQA